MKDITPKEMKALLIPASLSKKELEQIPPEWRDEIAKEYRRNVAESRKWQKFALTRMGGYLPQGVDKNRALAGAVKIIDECCNEYYGDIMETAIFTLAHFGDKDIIRECVAKLRKSVKYFKDHAHYNLRNTPIAIAELYLLHKHAANRLEKLLED